jgi:hypothetical protein
MVPPIPITSSTRFKLGNEISPVQSAKSGYVIVVVVVRVRSAEFRTPPTESANPHIQSSSFFPKSTHSCAATSIGYIQSVNAQRSYRLVGGIGAVSTALKTNASALSTQFEV